MTPAPAALLLPTKAIRCARFGAMRCPLHGQPVPEDVRPRHANDGREQSRIVFLMRKEEEKNGSYYPRCCSEAVCGVWVACV